MGFWTVVTTDGGLELLARAEGKRLDITRAVFGGASVPLDELGQQTGVSEPTLPASITDKISEGDTAHLKVCGTNKGLISAFPVHQIAIYAALDGGAEVLLRIAQREMPDIIPAEGDSPESRRRYSISTTCGNAASVVVHLDSASNATIADVEALRQSLDKKNGSVLVGPAEMIADLEPGGLLLITDDGNVSDYLTTLEDVLTQGYNLATGKGNTLAQILTVEVASALNLRKDIAGTKYTAATIGELVTVVGNLCRAAVSANKYVDAELGRITTTWYQVQEYILSGRIVTSTEAEAKGWGWASTPVAEHARIRQELATLWAAFGDVDSVLQVVNEGDT